MQTKQYNLIPSVFYVRDEVAQYHRDRMDGRKRRQLENYFNDVYKLFLSKLIDFEMAPVSTASDQKKLRALLDELIQIKDMIEGKQ